MMIIYGNKEMWDAIPPEEIARYDAFNTKFHATGELLGGYGVADAEDVKQVRVRDGMPAVTDGPYLESKEYLASWYLLDVTGEERALEIAAELPAARNAMVEVWPITHESS